MTLDPASARGAAVAALAAAAGCFALLAASCPLVPMVWDEGDALARAASVRGWVEQVAAVDQGAKRAVDPWSSAGLRRGWPYTVTREGHPALYGLLIAAGSWAGEGRFDPLTAARLGPCAFFSIAVGAVVFRLAVGVSPLAALSAAAALACLPRLFAHAHFASFDGPLVAAWLLAWACWPGGRPGCARLTAWGLVLGLLLSAKFTGWLAVPVFALSAAAQGRRAMPGFLAALGVAAATFVALNPALWSGSLADGLGTFLRLNLQRRAQLGLNISTLFFGRMYNLDHPLPWYNGLVWTAITVPVGMAALAACGIVAALRQTAFRAAGCELAAHWLVLLAVRALPLAPPHDGERLILPSFAFLACFAGIGVHALWRWRPSGSRCPLRPAAGPAAAVGLMLSSATSLAWYAPQWLSYYSLAIGGLPGAARAGMDPTYYWDALDDDARRWLRNHTAPGQSVAFAAGPPENLRLMQAWGWLPRSQVYRRGLPLTWYVVQHRASAFSRLDRELIAGQRPAYVGYVRDPDRGWGPWRLDVPVLWIFDRPAVDRAAAALAVAGKRATEPGTAPSARK